MGSCKNGHQLVFGNAICMNKISERIFLDFGGEREEGNIGRNSQVYVEIGRQAWTMLDCSFTIASKMGWDTLFIIVVKI